MNFQDIFYYFKKNKIKDAEYRSVEQFSFSFCVFRNKLFNYTNNITFNINIDGIINNKLAIINTEKKINKKNIKEIIKNLFEIASYTNKKNALIYKKKSKYVKYEYYNEKLNKIKTQEKIKLLFDIEKKIKNYDPRISDVEINYSENLIKDEYHNTANINLKSKTNFFTIGACVIIKEKQKTKTAYLSFTDNNISRFNIEYFVKKICDQSIKKLNNTLIPTKSYEIILDSKVTAILLNCYISQLNAEKIIKNISRFKNKINKKVANSKVTIFDKPLEKNINFTSYDDQGVPTKNRILIKNGILQTYLHNLETADFFNVKPTGHAVVNSKLSIEQHNISLKDGKIKKEELIKKINNGVYITDIEGLHAGMNIENGDFSLKAEGFLIKNGKIDKFIDMMTINANLYEIFNNIKNISMKYEFTHNNFAPCIHLEKISISSQ